MNTSTISAETALVYIMVIVSAVDSDMTDSELEKIGDMARKLPAFKKYNDENLIRDARNCAAILNDDEGLEAILGLIKEAIPSTGGYCPNPVFLGANPDPPETYRFCQRPNQGFLVLCGRF